MKLFIRVLYNALFLFLPVLCASQHVKRSENIEVIEALSGALLFLEDSQLRYTNPPRKNKGSKYFYRYNNEELLSGNNKSGMWESGIHFRPEQFRIGNKSLVVIPDYNLFSNLLVLYPFYFFGDDSLGYIPAIKEKANEKILDFKKNGTYNFWVELPGNFSQMKRSGPPNIDTKRIDRIISTFLKSKFLNFIASIINHKGIAPRYWLEKIKSNENPSGADAVLNVPNDADDTSLAVAMQKLYCLEKSRNNPKRFAAEACFVDTNALYLMSEFLDKNRTMADDRNTWIGKNTGAYLTWLKSEDEPTFNNCETGVIPLGVNNVDCVLNANVLFAMGLNNLTSLPGYEETVKLLHRVVKEKRWHEAGLYYPQYMIFPYCISRAYRDGKIDHPLMNEAMKMLLIDLLNIQLSSDVETKKTGSFPGGKDCRDHLSTALGLCALLNIGENIATKCGKMPEYKSAVENAVKYLVAQKTRYSIRHKNTFNEQDGKYFRLFAPKGYHWKPGLFFSSSISEIAAWKSEALSSAIVMEALAKYLLEYDKHAFSIKNTPKICITSYPSDVRKNLLEFTIR
ncbi:MAG: hypothetical protein K9H26_01840 [Prolixibacteraceae bacterium]|nr:hypothetical protein [Prolixibacteraceae bacterium]